MKHEPIARHAALQPLSRDHYVGLVQAQHLRKAAKGAAVDRRKALAEFLDTWAMEIVGHFAEEERLLGPLMNEPQRDRLDNEHGALRALAAEAKQRRRSVDPEVEWIEHLGRTLHDHIRWEERELFNAIQEACEPHQLAALQHATEQFEARRPRSRHTSASNP